MGVQICACDKHTGIFIKESSIDCYKKSDHSNYANIIPTNNNNNNIKHKETKNDNLYNKKNSRMKYKKVFNENGRSSLTNNVKPVLSSTFSNNNNNSNQTISDEKYIQYVIKIQTFFRKYLEKKKMIVNDSEKIEKEDNLSFRMNVTMSETIFSSGSMHNSKISKEDINNKNIKSPVNNKNLHKSNKTLQKCNKSLKKSNKSIHKSNKNLNNNNEETSIVFPFNIKNKIKMNYKYSGYLHKRKKGDLKKSENSSYLAEEEIQSKNEEKFELVKEGFGKFTFNDGTEFCGIFHENILQKYGKYTNINHKDKNVGNKNDKEIIITDNINYEEFIGEYKDYTPDGFGIYKNYITNLKITGIFKEDIISGIGIEDSVEGGYVYTGEFINNKKEGFGTIVWKDGSKYQGEFKDNQINGYGMIQYPDNKFYQGEIKNARMDGYGEFFWNNEKRYIGNYKNDKRNGFGIFIFKELEPPNPILLNPNKKDSILYNYSAYIGFWKNGNMDGFGMKVKFDGIKYGLWENGTKRRYLETNFALKTYLKWIDQKYNKIFLLKLPEITIFLEKCLIIDKDINPFDKEKI